MKIIESTVVRISAGVLLGIIFSSLTIYSIENSKSFTQIFIGFSLFIFPFIFIRSFLSGTGVFILIFGISMITYLVNKYMYQDFWIGVVLSFCLGSSISIFRVYPLKTFSPDSYKENQRKNFENE